MTQLNIVKRNFIKNCTLDKTLKGKIKVFMIEVFNYKIPLIQNSINSLSKIMYAPPNIP
jgi:hypothetical protein